MTPRSKKILQLSAAIAPFIIAGAIFGYGPLRQKWVSWNTTVYPVGVPNVNYGPQISQIPASGAPLEDSPVFSKPGALPYGFPQDLITEKNASIGQSYLQNHPGEHFINLFVEYLSQWSLEDNKKYFSAYIKKNNWEPVLSADITADENEAGFDAVKGEDGMRIIITQIPAGGVDVQISYRQYGRHTIE